MSSDMLALAACVSPQSVAEISRFFGGLWVDSVGAKHGSLKKRITCAEIETK